MEPSVLGEKSFPWRWPVVSCVAVSLLGPTLAIGASNAWGALVAAGIVLLEGAALILITMAAVRRREEWLRTRHQQLETAIRVERVRARATHL